MRRGQSKPIEVEVSGATLSDFKDIWLTIRQNDIKLTKKLSKNELTIKDNYIVMPITQQESLQFSVGVAMLQIKYNHNGVDATDSVRIQVKEIQDEDVMTE
jgi:hypothetical protein